MADFFQTTPDHIVFDIFGYALGKSTVSGVRTIVCFARSCKRMRKLFKSREVFQRIDLAQLFSNGKSDNNFVFRVITVPQIAYCEKFSCKICNVPESFTASMILSMPRLKSIAVRLGQSSTRVEPPPQFVSVFGSRVTSEHVIRAIESRLELEELSLMIDSPVKVVPMNFPPKLKKLSIVSSQIGRAHV